MNAVTVLQRAAIAAGLLIAARALPGACADPFAYAVLAALPGLAAADVLLPRGPVLARVAVGLAVGPLLTALAGVALMALGLGATETAAALAVVGAVAWPLVGALPKPAPDVETGDVPPRAVGALALGLAVMVALPPLLNFYIAIRGDAWTHGAIAYRILDGGLPPEDPRFAAISVRYVWFYNLFIALLGALRGRPPFGFMIAMNVATAFATVALIAMAAQAAWRRREAAVGAAVLATVGLNAGAWLLWPLHLLRALSGDVRGADAVAQQLRTIEFGSGRIIYSLSAPFAHMTSFLDKLLVGSPLAYAYLLMTVHLWATVAWLAGGRPVLLVWIAAAASGTMLFHGVVALSVIPVWVGTLALALLLRVRWPWLSAGRLGAAAVATLAGGLAAAPYLFSVAREWSPGRSGLRHHYLNPDPMMPWTIATACGVVLVLAWRPFITAWRERRAGVLAIGLYLGAMIVFACIVRLPQENQMKFVYQVFVPAAVLAAPVFGAWLGSVRRWGPRAALAALVLILPVALTLYGYLADPGRDRIMQSLPGESDLERWIRERTPLDAIVVDRGFRDLLMVRARRPLYLGTDRGPDWAAFPLEQVVERRRVVAQLYDGAAGLPNLAETLAGLGRPVYVVFRPEDDASTSAAWEAFRRAPDLFEVVYEHAGYRVARLVDRGSGA